MMANLEVANKAKGDKVQWISILHVLESARDKTESVHEVDNVVQNEEVDWTTPYLNWLRDNKLSDNKDEANKLKVKASGFTLVDCVLFKKSIA